MIDMGFKWDATSSADFAVAADMNPGTPQLLTTTTAYTPREEMAFSNSFNHRGAGQNVLYADGSVNWCATPYAGSQRSAPGVPAMPRDHIYTFGVSVMNSPGAGVEGAPLDAYDSVLLPTADGVGPPPVPATPTPAPVVAAWWLLGALALTSVAAGLVSLGRYAVRRGSQR